VEEDIINIPLQGTKFHEFKRIKSIWLKKERVKGLEKDLQRYMKGALLGRKKSETWRRKRTLCKRNNMNKM